MLTAFLYFCSMKLTPQQYYERNIARYNEKIAALRHRGRLLVTGEIMFFAMALGFVVLYTITSWGWPTLAAAALALAAYVGVRRTDERNDERRERAEALREVCQRERACLDGTFAPFDDGQRYVDAHHPYTFDIDVFGPQSLYNRICRTVSTGGSDRLAAMLSAPRLDTVDAQADAVSELASLPDWRKHYCAEGVSAKVDTEGVARALHAVAKVKVGRWVLSPLTPVVALAALAAFFATIVLASVTTMPSGVAVVSGIALLAAVLGLCHGTLMEAMRATGKLQEQITMFVRVVAHIADLKPESAMLKQLHGEVAGATAAFAEAGHIVKALDRRGNILGLVLFDLFLLSDLFLLRRFARWQKGFALRMDQWTEAVSEIDALVSMATYAYNTPQGVRAEVTDGDGVSYEGRGLRHPFLGAKAVGNDFSIVNRRYYIITGANMAGKSTFLRAVGINWLLAVCGMPVAADSLRLSRFNLFTSMRTTDDLTRGISYFNAELLRLEQLVNYCDEHPHTLIVLDEILKGTNSADKLNGSRMFLEYISQREVTGIIATHDLELSRIADEQPERFDNWCFEIELGAAVTYSYKITRGVARNQNATFLLKERVLRREKGKGKSEE